MIIFVVLMGGSETHTTTVVGRIVLTSFSNTIMMMEFALFKEIILNMAKSLTFPLPILAATHLQLIHGTELGKLYNTHQNSINSFQLT